MKRIVCALLSAVALSGAAVAAELDPLLGTGRELWKMSGEAVLRSIPDTFIWMDQAKSRLRFNARTSRAKLSLYGRNVQEAIFDVRNGQVVALSVSVYNRGDAGTMEKKSFDELLDEIESIVYSGTKINIDYYINEQMDPDEVDEIYQYFKESETDDLDEALDQLGQDYSADLIRLVRIKFISEMAN